MLHRLLARHDDLGWLSTFNEVLPAQTWLSAFCALYRTPLPHRIRHLKGFPKPFEAYRFWEHYLPGFSRRDRPPTADDVPPEAIEPARRASAAALRFQRRKRLLVKVTGWSRLGYFDRLYPDARFIHLRRDPRAVVSSWIKAGWLDVTSPPDSDAWQWGSVPHSHLAVWRELGRGPVLSVAVKIRLDLDDFERNRLMFPERVHEIAYEDLITALEPTLRVLCRFCELPWTPAFEAVVHQTGVFDSRQTWRRHLSDADANRVVEYLARTEPQHAAPARG